jgi:Bacterial Ig domain
MTCKLNLYFYALALLLFVSCMPTTKINISENVTIENQSLSAITNTPLSINITANNIKNLPLTYSIISQPSHGTLSGIAPNLIYTSNASYIGSDNFTFKVKPWFLWWMDILRCLGRNCY